MWFFWQVCANHCKHANLDLTCIWMRFGYMCHTLHMQDHLFQSNFLFDYLNCLTNLIFLYIPWLSSEVFPGFTCAREIGILCNICLVLNVLVVFLWVGFFIGHILLSKALRNKCHPLRSFFTFVSFFFVFFSFRFILILGL